MFSQVDPTASSNNKIHAIIHPTLILAPSGLATRRGLQGLHQQMFDDISVMVKIRKHWGVVHHHPWDSDGFCRSWVYDGICKSLQIPVKDYEHGQLLNTSSCSTWPTAPCTPMPWHTAHPSIESPYRRAAQHQVNCSRAGDWHLLSAVHHVHPLHSSGMNMMNF